MKKNTLRPISVLLLALLAVMPVAWAGVSHAQGMPQGSSSQGLSQGSGSTAGGTKQIEGAIKSVDPSGKMVTLDDGTQLTIPPTVSVAKADLKEGAIVKASYQERGGQNVVTSLQVEK